MATAFTMPNKVKVSIYYWWAAVKTTSKPTFKKPLNYGKTSRSNRKMTNVQISRFDAAEYLSDEATMHAYLSDMLNDGSTADFIQALNDVARARTQLKFGQGVG